MNWLTTDVTIARWIGLLQIVVTLVVLAVWLQQLRMCHRWHYGADDTGPVISDGEPPAAAATPDHDAARAAS